MELSVNTLHVREVDLLSEDHFVKGSDEEGVQESSVKDCKANNAADEFKVPKMLRIDARMRVDLKSVVVVCGVFEKTVERIEHLVTEKEKEFSVVELAFGLCRHRKRGTYLERPP
jgi:hypothetical protein